MKSAFLSVIGLSVLTSAQSLFAGLIVEQFLFEDGDGTNIIASTNEVGTAKFTGTTPVAQNASGDLVFVQDASEPGKNYFNNPTLTQAGGYTSGILELSFTVTGYNFTTGDVTGANAGFGLRDADNTDLFVLRIQNQNDTARLQHRIGTTNTNLVDFENDVSTFTTLDARAVVDLDQDTVDFYWSIDGGPEASSLGVNIGGTGTAAVTNLRVASNINDEDMGASDFIAFEDLTLTVVPEPSTAFAFLAMVSGILLIRRRS